MLRTRPDSQTALNHFPRLNRRDVNNHRAKRNTPLPRDRTMLEDLDVDEGDVHDREHDDQARDDSEEEEAIAIERAEDGERA